MISPFSVILPFSPNLRSVCSVGAELFSTEPQLRSVSVPGQTRGWRLPGEHTDTHFNGRLNMSYLCWIQVVYSLVCLCFHPVRFHSETWRHRWRQRWMSPQSGDTWSSTRPSLISYWHRYDLLTLTVMHLHFAFSLKLALYWLPKIGNLRETDGQNHRQPENIHPFNSQV